MCPGLIEAQNLEVLDNFAWAVVLSGVCAPASLKLIPRLNRVGTIKVLSGVCAPASLKRFIRRSIIPGPGIIRGMCPGLIEARRRMSRMIRAPVIECIVDYTHDIDGIIRGMCPGLIEEAHNCGRGVYYPGYRLSTATSHMTLLAWTYYPGYVPRPH